MTRPGNRPQNPQHAALSSALAGAVDLSALKERATARNRPAPAEPAAPTSPPGGARGPSAPPAVVDVHEGNFEAEVLVRSEQVLVVVAITTAEAESAQPFLQTLEKLAGESQGTWALAVVFGDENPRIAQAFGVQSVPTVVAVAAGQPVHAFAGVQPEQQLRRWVGELLIAVDGKLGGPGGGAESEPPVDPRFVEALDAVDRGDYTAAEAVYRKVLEVEPRNAEARAALQQVRFQSRVEAVPADAVDRADADPADVEAQLAAADFEVAVGRREAAFARLVGLVRATAGDERTTARERLLSLFEIFDPADPAVLAARRQLAAALY